MPVLEPDRGGHLRRGVPGQGQEDEPDRGSEAVEDGAREGRVSDHVATRDQHVAHLTTRERGHRS